MIKLKRDCNILTDAQVESLLMLLNAAYEATGDTNVVKCIDVLMNDTNSLILKEKFKDNEEPEERFKVIENLKPDLSAIKSIVPIADVIPEEIISKQEFLEMHDKAVERSVTEEKYRESHAWDIKKEKKVSFSS